MQEVSRVGAQGVTSKSKPLTHEPAQPALSSLATTHKATLTCGPTITRRVGPDFGPDCAGATLSDFAASELARKPLLHTRGTSRARSFDLEVTPWAPTRLTSYISHIGPEESSGASTLSQTAQARP